MRQLEEDDLFDLEPHLEPSLCSWVLWDNWTQVRPVTVPSATLSTCCSGV
jgi:hypothetical protein